MNKYDYGYEIAPGSTIEWAFKQVSCEAAVLELGPSNGNLAYHLSREKNCTIDIVEIDEEAGRQAARFCRNSCLGTAEGNLENTQWFQKLQNNRYDYIIILDVLEHIKNPEQVLKYLTCLIKENGKILLSVPNIAHNSVIIGLLANQFQYTPVGLLDDTHVRFYTYDSLKEMIHQAGYITTYEEIRQIPVGANEIKTFYGGLPRGVESYLKTRELGTAYQFLFMIEKGTDQADTGLIYNRSLDSYYNIAVFDADTKQLLMDEKIGDMNQLSISLKISADIKRLRIDPLNVNCILKEIQITAHMQDNSVINLPVEAFTGDPVRELYVFYDDDPQIYVSLPVGTLEITFSCTCICFDDEGLSCLLNLHDIYRSFQQDTDRMNHMICQKEEELRSLSRAHEEQANQFVQTIKELNAEISRSSTEIEGLNTEIKRLNAEAEGFHNELLTIQDSFWGKMYYKFKHMGRQQKTT